MYNVYDIVQCIMPISPVVPNLKTRSFYENYLFTSVLRNALMIVGFNRYGK